MKNYVEARPTSFHFSGTNAGGALRQRGASTLAVLHGHRVHSMNVGKLIIAIPRAVKIVKLCAYH